MSLSERMYRLQATVSTLQGIKTEEGTKNAVIMPFLTELGYNVFNPKELTPEFIADFGIKKGEKIDYAILKEDKPIILLECKEFNLALREDIHGSQLYRYFSVTSARFGILTNGKEYRFFTDIKDQNKMDKDPFFIFNLLNFNENDLMTLSLFTKEGFNESANVVKAMTIHREKLVRNVLDHLMKNPSNDFVRDCIKIADVHSGTITQTIIEQFKPIIVKVFKDIAFDDVDKAIRKGREVSVETVTITPLVPSEAQELPQETSEEKIATTQEETDAFYIIKSIVREVIPVARVKIKDSQSYCAILVDFNNRKQLVRLYFNRSQKRIGLFNEAKEEIKHDIVTLDDIYQFSDQLKATAKLYL